jgi:hypothetical protein
MEIAGSEAAEDPGRSPSGHMGGAPDPPGACGAGGGEGTAVEDPAPPPRLRDMAGDRGACGDGGLGRGASGASGPGMSPAMGPEADPLAPRTNALAGIAADSEVDMLMGFAD